MRIIDRSDRVELARAEMVGAQPSQLSTDENESTHSGQVGACVNPISKLKGDFDGCSKATR